MCVCGKGRKSNPERRWSRSSAIRTVPMRFGLDLNIKLVRDFQDVYFGFFILISVFWSISESFVKAEFWFVCLFKFFDDCDAGFCIDVESCFWRYSIQMKNWAGVNSNWKIVVSVFPNSKVINSVILMEISFQQCVQKLNSIKFEILSQQNFLLWKYSENALSFYDMYEFETHRKSFAQLKTSEKRFIFTASTRRRLQHFYMPANENAIWNLIRSQY